MWGAWVGVDDIGKDKYSYDNRPNAPLQEYPFSNNGSVSSVSTAKLSVLTIRTDLSHSLSGGG